MRPTAILTATGDTRQACDTRAGRAIRGFFNETTQPIGPTDRTAVIPTDLKLDEVRYRQQFGRAGDARWQGEYTYSWEEST